MTAKPEGSAGKKTNRAESAILPIIQGKPGVWPSIVRGLLTALVPIYSGGLKLYLLPYRVGVRKQFRLGAPVVCVGNLTTGGTGKTPTTQLICRDLQRRGLKVVVLSRGYGGTNEYGCAIVSNTEQVLLTANEAGDEPYLLARTLPGIPVVVGKDRRITGALAMKTFQPDIFVLDDGMQFWQLYRDMDIVLLNSVRPFDNGYPFPRGLLREPIGHIKRASAIVLTGGEMATEEEIAASEQKVRRYVPHKPVYRAALRPVELRSLRGDGVEYSQPGQLLMGCKAATLCALGNPESFEKTAASLGCTLVHTVRFRDHAAVSAEDLAAALNASIAAGAEVVLTTEKDAARIDFSSSPLPTYAVEVAMTIDQETNLIDTVASLVSCRPA